MKDADVGSAWLLGENRNGWVSWAGIPMQSLKEQDETWLPTGAACPEWLAGRESAGFLPPLSPIAHTVAFGKSSVLCLENVAVGLDRHEMPGERERERMNRNRNERL